jgi:hypothetical protein
MQRLFSTFADGWPDIGLLLQRLLVGAALLHHGITNLGHTGGQLSINGPVLGWSSFWNASSTWFVDASGGSAGYRPSGLDGSVAYRGPLEFYRFRNSRRHASDDRSWGLVHRCTPFW